MSAVDRHRGQHIGARLMLETMALKFSWSDRIMYICWEAYLKRLRAERIAHCEHELRQVRFCLVRRAGRDRDWIRSWNRYGIDPVPDDE
jgi:hypothetical protein